MKKYLQKIRLYYIKTIITVLLVLSISTAGCVKIATTQITALTSTNVNNVNSASSQAANGLSLSLALDATTYKPGQDVSIAVDVKNTRPETNDVPVSNDWSYNQLTTGQCDLGAPYGIAIFQGYYTSADFAAATPLALWDYNYAVPCPTSIPISYYDFQPLSDIAAAISSITSFPNSTYAINAGFTETGYWAGTSPKATKHNFDPGVYTVVAGDEWGSLVIVHFTVIN